MDAYNNPPFAGGPNTDALMVPLGLGATQLTEIIDFLRNGLNDSRAASEAFPFDRPTLSTEP